MQWVFIRYLNGNPFPRLNITFIASLTRPNFPRIFLHWDLLIHSRSLKCLRYWSLITKNCLHIRYHYLAMLSSLKYNVLYLVGDRFILTFWLGIDYTFVLAIPGRIFPPCNHKYVPLSLFFIEFFIDRRRAPPYEQILPNVPYIYKSWFLDNIYPNKICPHESKSIQNFEVNLQIMP